MCDLDVGKGTALELVAGVLDELDNGLSVIADARLVPDTGLRHTVQVLATDRDTDNEISQLGAVLLQSSLQSGKLVVDVVGTRGPDTEEQLGVGRDGGSERRDGGVGGARLDVRVQADGVEVAGCALQRFGCLELLLEVLLGLRNALVGSSSSVEAKDDAVLGDRAADGSRRDGEKGCETHGAKVVERVTVRSNKDTRKIKLKKPEKSVVVMVHEEW